MIFIICIKIEIINFKWDFDGYVKGSGGDEVDFGDNGDWKNDL